MTIIEITNLDSKTTFSIEINDDNIEQYKRAIADLYGDYLYCTITDINGNQAYISKQMLQKNLFIFRTVSEDAYLIEKLNKLLKEEREKVKEYFEKQTNNEL
jgi:uncharacterized membrane-anchored protein YjiN (DUF445 family)